MSNALTDAEEAYLSMHAGSNPVIVGGSELYVPQWIQEREGLYGGLHAVRETERAVLVSTSDIAQTGTTRKAWVPKSTLLTKKEYASKGVENDRRALANASYTTYLRNTAAENGVKLGNASSWDKIISKLASKGIKVKKREEF